MFLSKENGQTRERLTYKEAIQYAVNLSVALSKLGVRRGDVVAIGSKSFLHYIPTTLSVLFSGGTYTAYDEALGTGKSINLLYYSCITLNCKYTWLCPIIFIFKIVMNNTIYSDALFLMNPK